MKERNPEHLPNSFVLFVFICIGFFIYWKTHSSDDSDSSEHKKVVKTPEELRTEKISKCFSSWDGSHVNLEKIIRASMNDPKSYEHDKTEYWDRKDHLIVETSFRGKNAFGGTVKNWIRAKTDLNCHVIEVIEQGP